MISKDRYYLPFTMREQRSADGTTADEGVVEGYALIFEQSTVLFTEGGIEYREIISRTALDGVDLSDIVMNYNHDGKPVARTRNGTLALAIDSVGLKVTARLAGTAAGRDMLEEVRGGYIDKMSFSFSADRAADTFESTPGACTRRINRVTDVYDVAAVDRPAYKGTLLEARGSFAAEAARRSAEAEKRNKIRSIFAKTLEV